MPLMVAMCPAGPCRCTGGEPVIVSGRLMPPVRAAAFALARVSAWSGAAATSALLPLLRGRTAAASASAA